NVALNVVALGAQTSIISVVGNDEDAASLIQLFQENKIKTDFLLKSDSRITTNKTRIISRNQQMMRLDAEITNDITEQE
ncbi:PfkB family carbohydrate kinase, partial [Acinetobacter baumannii]